MDLHTVTEYLQPGSPDEVRDWTESDAWLAGGTWLFSEPQIHLRRLIDIGQFDWPALTVTDTGLEISATCRIAGLEAFCNNAPSEWKATPLIRECCHALLASFKICNEATVGGNLCLSLPAGAMISLTAALEGVCTLWPLNQPPREVCVLDFVTGNNCNVLGHGELLRSIRLHVSALRKSFAHRRFSLTAQGRSSVFLIGTHCPETGNFILTVTAATDRPVQLKFEALPDAKVLHDAVEAAVPESRWLDDVHGTPAHRKHLSFYFAEQIRLELAAASL